MKFVVVLIISVLFAQANAETCATYETVKDYLPARLAEFFPIKNILCGEEKVGEFKISGTLTKYYRDLEKAKVEPISILKYTHETAYKPKANDTDIDLAKENSAISRALTHIKSVDGSSLNLAIIVPGFTPQDTKAPVQLDPVAKERVDLGIKFLMSTGAPVIIFSGGNVRPDETPFNESYEMKRYAMEQYKVPEHMIAIDPFARHSTTNLRNAGRFMLAHEIKKGLIVTTTKQNFYFGYSSKSTFEERAIKTLGYKLGRFEIEDINTTTFFPSNEVFKKNSDTRDP